MLSKGAVESLPKFLWKIVMKLPEFNLLSDKSARIYLVFQKLGGAVAPPPPTLYAYVGCINKIQLNG